LIRSGVQGAVSLLMLVSTIASANPELIELGAEVYADYCQGCHGEDKDGLRNYNGSLENLRARLEGVTENMPDFAGFFDEEEIIALQAYLTDKGE
jgi:mono/diheme cytochrome c family protein